MSRKYVVEFTTAEIDTLRRLLKEDTHRLLDGGKDDLAAHRLRLAHYTGIAETLDDALRGPRKIVARWGEQRPAFERE